MHTWVAARELKLHIVAAPTVPSACNARVKRTSRKKALHVRTDRFICKLYLAYKYTHTHCTHTASAHLSCSSRFEAAHLDGSNASLHLRCVCVQMSKGDSTVHTKRFVYQAIYLSCTHTYPHAAIAHPSCTFRLETAHPGGSNASLHLRCAQVQISTDADALQVRSSRFVCQAIHQPYKHTHAASAHLGCSPRHEVARLVGSKSALHLQCAHAQAYTGDVCSKFAHQPFCMPGDLPTLQAHASSTRTPELVRDAVHQEQEQ